MELKYNLKKKNWLKPNIKTLSIKKTRDGEPHDVPEGSYGSINGSLS